MKRLLRLLARLFLGFAWCLVIAGAALIALEESDVLTGLVEERIERELGPLGAFVEVDHARLYWFEPGLALDGVTFAGEPDGEGGWRAGRERVRLSRVHLRLHPRLDPRRPIEQVEVHGGRVALSDAVIQAAQAILARRAREDAADRPDPTPPIEVDVRAVALEVELPDGSTLPLGSADVRSGPGVDGGLALSGRVAPSLAGAVLAPASIELAGESEPDGALALRAAARGLLLDSAGLREGDARRLFGLERFRGELALEMTARVPAGSGAPRADLVLRLADAELARPGEAAASDVDLRVELAFAPEDRARLFDPEAWSGRASLAGVLLESRVEAAARLGREAEPGAAAEAWARVRDLSLSESTLAALHVDELRVARDTWAALEPGGQVDAVLAVRVPRGRDGAFAGPPEGALQIDLGGRAEMTFHGWPDELGIRRGVPLPCTGVEGRIAGSYAGAAARRGLLAFVGLSAAHPTGTAAAGGLLASTAGRGEPDVDFEIRVPSIRIEPALGRALESIEPARDLWAQLGPSAGTARADWRIKKRAEMRGLSAVGRVELDGLALTWRDAPVPLVGLEGAFEVRWAERASVVEDAAPMPDGRPVLHRPAAALWRVESGPDGPLGLRAKGGVHQEAVAPAVERADIPTVVPSWLEIEIDDLLLRGRDFDVLAARFPEAAAEVQELRAQGRVDVAYRGRRPTASAPYRFEVEVAARPGEVVMTPGTFRRQTQDVTGRVLFSGREAGGAIEGGVRAHLFGTWGRDVVLGATAEVAPSGDGAIVVRGAGVDPSNPTLKGALGASLTGAAEDVDLEDLEIDGRLDFEARVPIARDPAAAGAPTARAFLRGNRFRSSTFALNDLTGVLVKQGEVLRSPHLDARLAGTRVELFDVMLSSAAAARELAARDPRLFDPGPSEGFVLQAGWSARGLALDREHLAPFVDEETLALLLERSALSGTIDVESARLVVVTERDGRVKVAIRGQVAPHGMHLVAGMPIDLLRGTIDVRDLVLEAGRLRGWWRIDDLDARIAGRTVENAAMTMTFVDGRLTVDSLRGRFAGGEVTSLGGAELADRAIAVDLVEPFAYAIGLRAEGVSVGELLGGLFESAVDDLGELSGSLRLRGRGGHVLDLAGSGSMRLENGRLWSIPLVRELFRSLGSDATAIFDRMEARWSLEEGSIDVQDVRVRSPLLKLVGQGSIELTGEVSADLQVRYGLLDKLGPLNRVVYWLNNRLWRVAVRGDLSRPEVVVRNSLYEFVFGFDDQRARSLPLPEWSPLSSRF